MSSSARLGGWEEEWPTRKPTFLEIPSLESLISLGLMLGCDGHFLAVGEACAGEGSQLSAKTRRDEGGCSKRELSTRRTHAMTAELSASDLGAGADEEVGLV